MAIIIMLRDVPPGVTVQEAAALCLGPERVAQDVLIAIRTVDDCEAWDRSMAARFAGMPMPAFVETCMDPICPASVPQQPASEAAPADIESVIDRHGAPVGPDYRGITFANLAIEAQEHGLTLTDTAAAGYKLQNGHGCIVRKQLADLVPIIRSTKRERH